MDPKLRDSVLEQLREQHKTWKKNMRTQYFGKTRESILQWRGSVPPKEPISLTQWQKFIDNEIEDRQLASRQSGRENRAKKMDVHYSGRTSYAEVEHRMQVKFNFSITTEIYYSSLFYFAGPILILLYFISGGREWARG